MMVLAIGVVTPLAPNCPPSREKEVWKVVESSAGKRFWRLNETGRVGWETRKR